MWKEQFMARSNQQNDQLDDDFPKTSQPALRALHAAGYTRLSQLADVSDADLLKLHGFGPKALRILRGALRARERSGDTSE
jgi:hypothetical protein